MPNFYLSSKVSTPWTQIQVLGDCLTGSTFSSSDENIANVVYTPYTLVNTYGVGEVTIYETTANCTNTGGITLQVTEDGMPFFMDKQAYNEFTIWEIIFVMVIILISWFIRFLK